MERATPLMLIAASALALAALSGTGCASGPAAASSSRTQVTGSNIPQPVQSNGKAPANPTLRTYSNQQLQHTGIVDNPAQALQELDPSVTLTH